MTTAMPGFTKLYGVAAITIKECFFFVSHIWKKMARSPEIGILLTLSWFETEYPFATNGGLGIVLQAAALIEIFV